MKRLWNWIRSWFRPTPAPTPQPPPGVPLPRKLSVSGAAIPAPLADRCTTSGGEMLDNTCDYCGLGVDVRLVEEASDDNISWSEFRACEVTWIGEQAYVTFHDFISPRTGKVYIWLGTKIGTSQAPFDNRNPLPWDRGTMGHGSLRGWYQCFDK